MSTLMWCFVRMANEAGHRVNHMHWRTELLDGPQLAPDLRGAMLVGCCNSSPDHRMFTEDIHYTVIVSYN